jgi:hypothetical protein
VVELFFFESQSDAHRRPVKVRHISTPLKIS